VADHALGGIYPMRRIEIGVAIGIPTSIPVPILGYPHILTV